MRTPSIPTILAACALAFAAVGSTDALAQGNSKKAAAAAEKKPGKTCSDLASNSQAHKDCIARQAKSGKATKAPKLKAEKSPRKG